MSRTFVATFEDVAITAAQDLFEIAAPATGVVMILDWGVFQTTDLGDAAEEILHLQEVRGDGTVTSGSGGTTVTPQPLDNGSGTAGATVEANNTTRMAVGTGVLDIIKPEGWNVRIPFEKVYIPELRPIVTPSDRWTIALDEAPADSLTCHGWVTFVEIGG